VFVCVWGGFSDEARSPSVSHQRYQRWYSFSLRNAPFSSSLACLSSLVRRAAVSDLLAAYPPALVVGCTLSQWPSPSSTPTTVGAPFPFPFPPRYADVYLCYFSTWSCRCCLRCPGLSVQHGVAGDGRLE